MNKRYAIWRGLIWRLVLVVAIAAIFGLVELVGHLLAGADLLRFVGELLVMFEALLRVGYVILEGSL